MVDIECRVDDGWSSIELSFVILVITGTTRRSNRGKELRRRRKVESRAEKSSEEEKII